MFDEDEFNNIISQYGKEIYRYCYSKCSDKSLADDVYNQILIVLWQKWDTLGVKDNIRAYMYRTADLCIRHSMSKNTDYLRKNEKLINELSDSVVVIDKYFSSGDAETDKLIEIRDSLPEKFQKIYEYRYIYEMTLIQISENLQIPYATVAYKIRKIDTLVKNYLRKNKKS